MATQIPSLLEPYLSLPPETSQLVLTGILGASTNWLVLRYLYSLLKPTTTTSSHQAGGGAFPTPAGDVKVLLVSFMRNYAFWKDGAGRLGLNLDAQISQRKFAFVDGLSRLYAGSDGASASAVASTSYLDSPRLADVARVLHAAVGSLGHGREGPANVVLVLDAPDAWLAAGGDGVTASALRDLVLDLREKVHASIITVAADEPLIASQTTTLEKEHATFVLSLAHEAEAVLSLRMLDTGTAKDVSGVVRITRGGAWDSLESGRLEEHEYLYHVGGDGSVKVFERGQ